MLEGEIPRITQEAAIWLPFILAFYYHIRKEIGKRDEWTCQGVDDESACVWELLNGVPARYQDGFMVHISHYDHTRDENYQNPDNGRVQCLACHYLYELRQGNPDHAMLIANSHIYHWEAQCNRAKYKHLDFDIKTVFDVLNLVYEQESMVAA